MKKYFLTPLTILLAVYLFSCNNPGANSENSSDSTKVESGIINTDSLYATEIDKLDQIYNKICEKAGGLPNFFILKKDALTMMHDFDSIYKRVGTADPIDALPNSFFLDSCSISQVALYLKTNRKKGIRIFMGCELNPDGSIAGPYKNKAGIFIFPTDYDGSLVFPKSKNVTDKASTLHQQGCLASSPYFKAYAGDTENKIKKFDDLYRKNPMTGEAAATKDALSQAVWVDSCVVFALDRIVKAFGKTHDGAYIMLGAYKTMDPATRPSQKYDTQSTMLIVITKKDGSHTPDWDIIDRYISTKAIAPGSFNHGELCPKVCD